MSNRRQTSRKPLPFGIRSPKVLFALLSIVLLGLAIIILYAYTQFNWYWIWLLALNPVTLFWYWFDKQQARQNQLRVPEVVLHGLGLAGGFIGGWLGVLVLRHKSQKQVFYLSLAFATLLHGIGIILGFIFKLL